ncbi:MAG: bifunctional DNA-formamidopyrimidine glycosylase/DNA-(apurinic or apyrimidinic site) lyase [Pseudomonadota bacterium]
MPELPEVETVRRGLEPALTGEVIAEAIQRRSDLRWPLPPRFAARLEGRRVERLRRRSKYLLIDIDPSDGAVGAEAAPETWIVHLGMSGRLSIHTPNGTATPGAFAHGGPTASAHDHVSIRTASGTWVVYNDARRFGAMDLWPTDRLIEHRWLASIGPEPLSNAFSGASLAEALKDRMSPIKAALLDQKTVAGLGNIYVCEALNRARIHPKRMAGSLSRDRIDRLVGAIRDTLTEAIAAGGSSLRDYRQADGELGYFQHAFRVYGREGDPCPCNAPKARVLRIVQSGRSTFYCSRCQR